MENEVNPVDRDSDPNDGISVVENEDGTFTIEWDPTDPRWAMFNDFKEEDFTNMIMEYCRQVLGEDEFNSVLESVDDE